MTYDDQLHREFGRHSGIPECCIEHWLVWKNKPKSPEECERITKRAQGQIWHHSPCPACEAAGNVVKVHICGDRCPERDEIEWRARQRDLAARRSEMESLTPPAKFAKIVNTNLI